MGRRIRRTNRRSNLRKVRKNTMKRKTMKRRNTLKRKSMKRRNNKRNTMRRRNTMRDNFRWMRGGSFGKNVIVSMGKLVDSSINTEFIDRLDRTDAKVFISAVSNDSEKIADALTVYSSLKFEGEYVISCSAKSELTDALSYGTL